MAVILSIIVPVFNVERYIEKCINSLICQNIDRSLYEIILIDDGSSDNSGELCDSYAMNYTFISVIHQRNQGLSAARNTGLRIAVGKYVLFVDSDDYLQENVLADLVKKIEVNSLDILRFKYRRVREDCSVIRESIFQPEQYLPNIAIDGHDFLVNHLGFECYACQFIIRKRLLIDNGLFFKEGIIYEDTEWTPRLMETAHRVSDSDILVYNYLERAGSITKGRVEKVVSGQMALIDFLKEQMSHQEDKRWYEGMIAHTVVTIITNIGSNLFSQRESLLRDLERKKIYPLSLFNASKSAKRKIRIINRSPRIACLIIHIMNP